MQTLSPRGLSYEMWQDGVVVTNASLHPVLHSMNSGAKKKKQPKNPELLRRKAASKSASQKKYD